MKRFVAVHKSPIGEIYSLFEGEFLVELSLNKKPSLSVAGDQSIESCPFGKELDAYFAGRLAAFSQKVKFLIGTPFEQKVWLALKNISCGETRSYKWIAQQIGRPGAVRAVGQALGKNPLPIILPCHRVIASDGSLGGYSGGIEVKASLLKHEGALPLKSGRAGDKLKT